MIKQQSPPHGQFKSHTVYTPLQLEGGGVVTDILSYLFKFPDANLHSYMTFHRIIINVILA